MWMNGQLHFSPHWKHVEIFDFVRRRRESHRDE